MGDNTEIETLKDELKVRDDQIKVLTDQLEKAKASNSGDKNLQSRIEQLEAHNEQLLEQNQSTHIKMKAMEEKNTEEKNDLISEINEANTKVKELEENISLLNINQEELEGIIKKYKEKEDNKDVNEMSEGAEKEPEEKSAGGADDKQKLAEAELLIKKLTAEAEQFNSGVKQANTEEADLFRNQIERLKEQNTSLQKQLDSSAAANNDLMDKLKDDNDWQTKELDIKKLAQTTSEERVEKLEEQAKNNEDKKTIRTQELKQQSKEKEAEELAKSSAGAINSQNFKEQKQEQLKKKIELLENTNQNRELEIDELQLDKKKLEKDAQAYKAKTIEEKHKNEGLNKKNELYRKDIKAKDLSIKELKNQLDRVDKEKLIADKMLVEIAQEKKDHDRQYTEMKDKYEEMASNMSVKDSYIIKFGDESEKLKKQIAQINKTNKLEKDKKIQELEKENHNKDVELQVQNQMIQSANKMVQVKTIEVNRLQKKISSSAKVLKSMNANDRLSMEHDNMSYASKQKALAANRTHGNTRSSLTNKAYISGQSSKQDSFTNKTIPIRPGHKLQGMGGNTSNNELFMGKSSPSNQSKAKLANISDDAEGMPGTINATNNEDIAEQEELLENSKDEDQKNNQAYDIIQKIENNEGVEGEEQYDEKSVGEIQRMLDSQNE